METKQKKDYRFQKLNGINNRLKHEIQYIWRMAVKEHHDWDKVHDSLTARVYNDKGYGELPQYYRYGLRQYESALSDYVWQNNLEWVHWYDGKFVHKNLPYGEGFDQNKIDRSAHVWAGTETVYFESDKTKV